MEGRGWGREGAEGGGEEMVKFHKCFRCIGVCVCVCACVRVCVRELERGRERENRQWCPLYTSRYLQTENKTMSKTSHQRRAPSHAINQEKKQTNSIT